jgi:hypothetical protein
MDLGGGYGSVSSDITPDALIEPFGDDVEIEFTGASGLASLNLGAFLSPNLVLFGEFFGSTLVDPTMKIAGEEFETADLKLNTYGFGAGVAYYLSDNWFLQGTLFASQMDIEIDGETLGETDLGIGFKGTVGAAWPVSNKVALGASAQVFYASMKDKGENAPTWKSFAGGLEFTFIWIPGGNMKGTAM